MKPCGKNQELCPNLPSNNWILFFPLILSSPEDFFQQNSLRTLVVNNFLLSTRWFSQASWSCDADSTIVFSALNDATWSYVWLLIPCFFCKNSKMNLWDDDSAFINELFSWVWTCCAWFSFTHGNENKEDVRTVVFADTPNLFGIDSTEQSELFLFLV